MSIISKEIEVTLDSKGIIRYENLGYDIPKYFVKSIKRKHLFWLTEWKEIEDDIKKGLYTIDNYLDKIKRNKINEYNESK